MFFSFKTDFCSCLWARLILLHCNLDSCADVWSGIKKNTVHILYCRDAGEVSLTVKHMVCSVLTNPAAVQIRTIQVL